MKASHTSRHAIGGFSLVELLVVMAIISILAFSSSVAINSIMNSGNINRTVDGIELFLDKSHAYAMGHDTYVWTGFYRDPSTQKLWVGSVAGITGQQGDLSAATYSPISPVQAYDNMILSSPNAASFTDVNPSSVDVTTSNIPFQMKSANGTVISFQNTVQFSPRGEASVLEGTSHCIQIVLQPVRGGNVSNLDPNLSLIQIFTLTGQVQVFRK